MNSRDVAQLLLSAERYEDVLGTLGADDGTDLYRNAHALSIITDGRDVSPSEGRIVGEFHYGNKNYKLASDSYKIAGDAERTLGCLRLNLETEEKGGLGDTLRNAVEMLVNEGQWSLLISLLTNGQPRAGKRVRWKKSAREAVLTSIRRDRLVLTFVIPLLAMSEKLSAADAKAQHEVSEFLANSLLKGKATASWSNYLSRKTAGAAIERAGKDIASLEFYENWRDVNVSNHDRKYAENRWVICKLRQAQREEAEGSTKKAAKYRHSAEQVMQRYGWDEQDVVDAFPKIEDTAEPVDRTATKPGVLSQRDPGTVDYHNKKAGHLGSITYRFIPVKQWINLESEDGLCARILLKEKNVTSEDVRFSKDGESSYRFDEWDLCVSWPSSSEVRITQGDESCEISFGETGHEAS